MGTDIASEVARTLAGLGAVRLDATLDAGRAATLALAVQGTSTRVTSLPSIQMGGAAATSDLEIIGMLGEGGMGIVELARQRSLGRDVAIKRLRDPDDATAVAALLGEASITGALEHPGIVPVHALGRDASGRPLMVMKKIDGVTLRALLDDDANEIWREHPDRIGYVVGVARRLCDALGLAHARGYVHRDVKPENIMLGAYGEVSLLDWGIAIRTGEVLAPNAIAGTPVYMAPEMLRPASGELGPPTDVFLLGATLHECVTGKPPHEGNTLLAVLASVAEPRTPTYGDDVPEELASLLRRAMHPAPTERFADARALGRALDAFVVHRAAANLARTAEERLAALETAIARAAPANEVHGIFHESRFAFEHALREHPEHVGAKRGRERVLSVMGGYALAQRERGVLASMIDALGVAASPDLKDGLIALDREIAAGDAQRERLHRIEADHDMHASARERAVVVRLAAFLITVGAPLIGWLAATGRVSLDATALVGMTVPPMVLVGIALAFFRRRIMKNRVDRQLALSVVIAAGLLLTHRFLSAVRGWPLGDVASGDSFIIATAAALTALTIRRAYFVVAALFVTAGIAAPFFGAFGVAPMLVAVLASLVTIWAAPTALQAPALGAATGS